MEASALSKYMLFRGMNENEIKDALNLLEAKERNYEKDETILYAGDKTAYMGIVLDGSVSGNYKLAESGQQTTATAEISKANIPTGQITPPTAKNGLTYTGSA